jgi:hypothetical protein
MRRSIGIESEKRSETMTIARLLILASLAMPLIPAFCAPLVPKPGFTSTVIELKGVAVGASQTEFFGHFGGHVTCKPPMEGDHVLTGSEICEIASKDNPDYQEETSFAGHHTILMYTVYQERVVGAAVAGLVPADYDEVLAAMTMKFGKPVIITQMNQNAFGAQYENQIAKWTSATSAVQLSKYYSDLQSSGLEFFDLAYFDKVRRLTDDKARAAAKDM